VAVSAVVSAGRRVLPRGYADFARQLAIWFAFYLAYQVTRGVADRDAARAFENGLKVIDVERRAGGFFELSLQGLLTSSDLLIRLTSWTYWLSQFAVLGLALLWVYLRRTDSFLPFRNTVLLANVIGLVGYVSLPTAPPRMFPDFGFVDTLAHFSSLNHGSAAIELASNPYAAMPSLHGADALIVGVAMALVVRHWPFKVLWLLWPAWVWFTVIATGNHFWLDIAAGIAVAGLAAAIVFRKDIRRRCARSAA
jgi:membrane-associated phospholipid phosphatase